MARGMEQMTRDKGHRTEDRRHWTRNIKRGQRSMDKTRDRERTSKSGQWTRNRGHGTEDGKHCT